MSAVNLSELDQAAAGMWRAWRSDPQPHTRDALALIYWPLAERAAASESAGDAGLLHRRVHAADAADLRQMAWLCLVELIQDYQPDRASGSFARYASALLRLRLKAEARRGALFGRRGRHLRVVSLDHSPNNDPHHLDRQTELADESSAADLADIETADYLAWLRQNLGPRMWALLHGRLLAGLSLDRIAAGLGVSESTVSLWWHRRLLPRLESLAKADAALMPRLEALIRRHAGRCC